MKRTALILCPLISLIVLLSWQKKRATIRSGRPHRFDALLALQGSGRDIWAD